MPTDLDLMAVTMTGGVAVFVPASFRALTTYVLLEQEDWFEAEIQFVRAFARPGMRSIDIGANYGVYTVTLAGLSGPTGHVVAFEPARAVAAALRRSAIHNRFSWIQVENAAVADRNGVGTLGGKASELMSLDSDAKSGEAVDIVSLDAWAAQCDRGPIDFMKIDAEGAEAAIIAGGQRFFRERAPLIMMEVRRDAGFDFSAVRALMALGYRPYRLVPGPNVLAPVDIDADAGKLDGFLLNLFCCKPETAAALAARGLLAQSVVDALPAPPASADPFLSSLAYHAGFAPMIQSSAHPAADVYALGLARYAQSRDPAAPAEIRFAALAAASTAFDSAVAAFPSFVRRLSAARAAADLGARTAAVGHLQAAVRDVGPAGITLDEPFLAPAPRFERLSPGTQDAAQWIVTALTETVERASAYSSAFLPNANAEHLRALCAGPFASAEMERRRQLALLRQGKIACPEASPLLARGRPDCLNPHLWDTRRRQSWSAAA